MRDNLLGNVCHVSYALLPMGVDTRRSTWSGPTMSSISGCTLPPISRLRAFLREEWLQGAGLECEEVVKRWPLYVINGGVHTATDLLRSHQLAATPAISSVAYELEAAQAAFTQTVLPRYRAQLAATFSNRAFYAIEHVECLAMQTFLRQLQMRVTLGSVIWLHDGVWIPDDVSESDILFAERATLQALSLSIDDERLFQVRRLEDLAERALDNLRSARRRVAPFQGRVKLLLPRSLPVTTRLSCLFRPSERPTPMMTNTLVE